MLIDGGNQEDEDFILNYLEGEKIQRLDYVVATHPHEDHIGSLASVIRHFEVGTVILPDKIHTTQIYEEMLNAIEETGTSMALPEVAKTYGLGKEAVFTVLAPDRDYGDNLNNWSVGLRLTYGSDHFLFYGDAEKEAEEDLLKSGQDLSADVLKVSHHGSETSNSEKFLDAVNPTMAVISCGQGNSYGHPDRSVVESLEKRDIRVYRTDRDGTLVAVTEGNGVIFEKQAGGTQGTEESFEEEALVYITKTGKKYHREDCRYLKSSGVQISLEEAREQGLSPCRECEPPEQEK